MKIEVSNITKRLYEKTLGRGISIVRCMAIRHEFPEPEADGVKIEIIDLKKIRDSEGERGVFMSLRFYASNYFDEKKNESDLALFVKGPTFNNKILTEDDWLEELEITVSRWLMEDTYPTFSLVQPFVATLKVKDRFRNRLFCHQLQPSHPVILPCLTMALGHLRGQFHKIIEDHTRSVTHLDRVIALRSFLFRFESFVAQAQKESVRQIFGEPFKG